MKAILTAFEMTSTRRRLLMAGIFVASEVAQASIQAQNEMVYKQDGFVSIHLSTL